MRIAIFIVSCFVLLLVFFGLYMYIGMRGDFSYLYVLITSLPCFVGAFIFVISAFKFMKQRKEAVPAKKWPRIILIIFLSLNLLYWSIIVFLGNILDRIIPTSSTSSRFSNAQKGDLIFFVPAFIISLIILLPPVVYLIKGRKREVNFSKPGYNKRVFAFLLDYLIACGIGILLSFLGVRIYWLIWAACILFKDFYNGRSIGKMCASMQVINKEGKPANFTQMVMRNIFMIIPFFPLIEYFVMVQDSEGRRIGDQVAKTRVIDLQSGEKDNIYLFLSLGCLILIFLLWGVFLKR